MIVRIELQLDNVTGSPLSNFADKHGLVLIIKERGKIYRRAGRSRFWAEFNGVEIKNGALSNHGNGETQREAVLNYARKISGKRLVISDHYYDRIEVDAPADLAFSGFFREMGYRRGK